MMKLPTRTGSFPEKCVQAILVNHQSFAHVENYPDSHFYDNLLYAHGSRRLPRAGKVRSKAMARRGL